MTKKTISISLLQDADIPELLDFYNLINKDNRDKEKFLWEFYNAPAGKAIYVIAKDADTQKIIGSQCAIPVDLITHTGDVIRTGKSEDTLVHPDYRGLSIFENMYAMLFEKCRESGIKYLWGFTSAKKPFLRLGFTIPFDHSQSLMVLNIFSSYKYLSNLNAKNTTGSLLKIFALCFLARLISFKRYWPSSPSLKNKFSFSAYDKSVVKENNLIPENKYKGYWIKQDISYISWRIEKNPYLEGVHNVYFSRASDIVANLIFNHHKNGTWYLINDTYADGITADEKAMMMKKSIALLAGKKQTSVNLIRAWDFRHNQHGLDEIQERKKAGFFHLDRGISFVWKSLDPDDMLDAMDFNLSRLASQGTI
ncbi:MAG: GNAT family N-acetyltransferase [Saprospiraceae bacterium]|uniref:GNAT family N-acetyltransferase n=1 Tax=Candidatus Opimibacter skivensis TaxID=2982028 RepID=A0A9D7SVK6_9BACT|nr:GNAT family N-acetyltransferase [Candidatus Opimibacter skivensis]